jgi:LuxR family maltose regulon positive regulatory protein
MKAMTTPHNFWLTSSLLCRRLRRILGQGFYALQSPQPPPIESILTALLNEITTIPNHFVLVLDDYHVIDSKPVDNVLTFLLEHLPPKMHLIIASREDPHLPLARLRTRGLLTELRAADLRFSPAEAVEFHLWLMRLIIHGIVG